MLRSKSCLGLDIGGRDVKLVELRKTGRKYEVVQAVRIALPEGEPAAGAASALETYLTESRTWDRTAVCSLPAHICSIKFAQVPRAKPSDMVRMIRFEAESQIPMPLSELVWSFAADGEKTDAMRHVVIGAARRNDIDILVGTAASAKITPSAVMVSSLAAARALPHAAIPGQPVMIIDIGKDWTDIVVADGDRITAARSIRLGSEDLTEAYIHDFKVDAGEAERLKRTHGIAMEARVAAQDSGAEVSAVELWADRLSEEIRRSALSISSGNAGGRPVKVILTGGSAGLPSMTDGISRRTGIPVEIGDPWAGMSIGEVCSHTMRELPAAFVVATGLARAGLDNVNQINLMPQHIAEERLVTRKRTAVLAGLAATALILGAFLLNGDSNMNRKYEELRDVRAKILLARKEMRSSTPGVLPAVNVVKTVVGDIEKDETSCLEILRQLSVHLPRSIWLTEFSYEGGKSVVLKGGALSNSAVADTADILYQLGLFDSVTLDYSNLAPGENSQGYDFQITCTLQAPKKKGGHSGAGSGADLQTGIIVQ